MLLSSLVRMLLISMAGFTNLGSRSKTAKFVLYPVIMQYFTTYILAQFLATWDCRGGLFFDKDSDSLYARGIYNDFTSTWFLDVGSLIHQIAFFNMFMPPIEFFIFFAIRHLRRMWDQRTLIIGDYKCTHCRSIYEFTEIYSGPEFVMHYKYVYVASSCFIAMAFGPIMPILFLYCLLSLLSLFLVERCAMIYCYRKPPMYEDDSTIFLLRLLALTPGLYAFMSICAFSNQ